MRWLFCLFALALFGCTGSAVDRVEQARKNREEDVRELCRRRGLTYPVKRLFLRAFKHEKLLEVWGADRAGAMVLIKTYPVAAQSGGPGPKRKEGDRQVPEGFYTVDRFNPVSKFHLSLGINYPNASDRVRSDANRPGGDIFIHGDRKSIGCLAMTDPVIEEIYLLALGARAAGIPVHLFPCRMEGPVYRRLRAEHPELTAFWDELVPVYRAFEQTKRVPTVKISRSGSYSL